MYFDIIAELCANINFTPDFTLPLNTMAAFQRKSCARHEIKS